MEERLPNKMLSTVDLSESDPTLNQNTSDCPPVESLAASRRQRDLSLIQFAAMSILADHDPEGLYGIAMISQLRERTRGLLEVATGTLYPALRTLGEKGLISGKWEDAATVAAAGRRPRRYWYLTPSGKQALHETRDLLKALLRQ